VLDRWAAHFAAGLAPSARHAIDALTHLGESTWYLVAAAVFGIAALVRGRRRLFLVGLYAFIAIAGSGILTNMIKVILGRHRPGHLANHDFYHFAPFQGLTYDWQSMPSGHATTSAAVAVVLCVLLPRVWPVWLVAGVVVAATRVLINVHYVSDVVFGCALGLVFAVWLRDGFRRWFRSELALFPKVDGLPARVDAHASEAPDRLSDVGLGRERDASSASV